MNCSWNEYLFCMKFYILTTEYLKHFFSLLFDTYDVVVIIIIIISIIFVVGSTPAASGLWIHELAGMCVIDSVCRPLFAYAGQNPLLLATLGQRRLLSLSQGNVCNRLEVLRQQLICFVMCPGPSLPMATVDIRNPEINNKLNMSHMNNMVHSGLNKKEKKVKGKRKKLTKADIGTPSNFQWVFLE